MPGALKQHSTQTRLERLVPLLLQTDLLPDRSTSDELICIRVTVTCPSAVCHGQIMITLKPKVLRSGGDLRSGKFCDLSIISQ